MPYVPPKYPGAIPTAEDLPDRIDNVDWFYAARYNELKKELRAALIELGVLPKGSHADVKTRLDVQQHKIIDNDSDSYEDVEKTADVDEAVTYLKNILVRKFNDDGILDLPKQSRVRIYLSSNQLNLTHDVPTKVLLDGETYDNQNEFASNRFTAKKAGYYQVNGAVLWLAGSVVIDKRYAAFIEKNGSIVAEGDATPSVDTYFTCNVSEVIYLAANDYLELFAVQYSAVDTVDIYGGIYSTFMSIHKLS